jgi:hypothetical protein
LCNTGDRNFSTSFGFSLFAVFEQFVFRFGCFVYIIVLIMAEKALKLQIVQLKQQLDMKEESAREEKAEIMETTRTQVETLTAEKETLTTTVAELQRNATEQDNLTSRMQRLEEIMQSQTIGNNAGSMSQVLDVMASNVLDVTQTTPITGGESSSAGIQVQQEEGVVMGKEKSIDLTFGDDTSPHLLEKFLAHYSLVDRINKARGVRVWKKAEYRALMLRSALRGTASEYVENAEQIMLSSWVSDDQGILKQLKQRYITNAAIELRIIQFETASQAEGEPLGEYLTRLQKLMEKAYSSHPQYIKQVRVVWQFLNGLRDKDVREALIKEKWMADGQEAKSYDEILKIAETVVNTKVAGRATGKITTGNLGVTRESRGGQKSPTNKSRYSAPSRAPYPGVGRGNWECWFCKKKDHDGGWAKCPVRIEKDPQWKPSRNSSDFGRAPHR